MDVNLVLFKKNGTIKSFRLPSSVTIIGRRQECDLCIPLMVVSRRHCQLDQDRGRLRISDLGSRNGTYINGQRIDQAELNPGDKVQVGPLTFGVQIDQKPAKLSTPDSVILRPPKHLAVPEKEAVDQGETFADAADADVAGDPDAADADVAGDPNAAQIPDGLVEELYKDDDSA